MKKVLSLLLSFILLLAVFPVSTISAEALEDDVIEIRTIAELYNINNNMSGNYKLMNDIDMTQDTAVGGDWDFMGNGWEPVGSNGVYGNTAFTGTFDGNGHKIIGMRIVVNSKPSGTSTIYLGLFAKNEGTIRNLGIDETSIVNSGDYSGGICAYNNGVISNCYNKAKIISNQYSGGICGYSQRGTVCESYNTGDVKSSGGFSGGICGHSESVEFTNCNNSGTITASHRYDSCSGGISGSSNNCTIMCCVNKGSVHSSVLIPKLTSVEDFDSFAGGMCGISNKDNIENSYNTNNITASINITEVSYSSGLHYYISHDRNPVTYYGVTFHYGEKKGVPGSINNKKFVYCGQGGDSYLAYQSIYSYSSGICGCSSGTNIENCYNTNDIIATHSHSSSQAKSSGIANWCNISNCYNIGNATNGIGTGVINSCYYLGTAGTSNTGAKALTSAQFQLEMCMPDFDFVNTWVIYSETEYKYPQLRNNIQEVERHLESVEITIPDKTSYIIGDEFDTSGMVVTGHYDDGTTQEITNYELTGFTGELGKNNITVTVGEKSAVFYVTVHDEGEWKTEKEPTCTENGEKKLYCTDCGALLDTEEIPAKGHKEVVDKGHDATCTESGLTDGSHCSACDTILTEQEIIPAKGHIPYQNWETIKNPTCISHGEKVRHCSVCGEIVETAYIDVTDHQLVIDESKEATCLTSGLTEGSHCSVCNTVIVPQQVIQPKGHKWDNGEVTIQPSCSTSGEKVYHCKNCGQTKSETIPILGHDYSNEFTIDKEATCTEDGLKSKHCSRCDSTTEKTIIPKTNHRPSSEWIVVKEATTTEEGLEEKHCRDCGVVLDSRTIPLLPQLILGDVDGDGVVSIIDATCIQRYLAEILIYSYNETAADTDGDGKVTILDATSIQRYLAELPCFAGIGSPIS